MTGIEPGAIAGVALKGAGKAIDKVVDNEAKEAETLLRIAEKSGELDDAALIRAKRAVVKQHIYLKVMQPLGMLFGVPREYFNTQFSDDMAERLADVPEEEIVSPRPSVAGPAMLGLGFTLDEPQLKAMYLNLLAAASDSRVQDTAHPSFAEVIRQLSAEEAGSLAAVLNSPLHLPIIEIRVNAASTENPTRQGFLVEATHVLDWHEGDKQVASPERAIFVDNWIRLGLVSVDYSSFFTDEGRYSWAETTPLVLASREKYDTPDLKRVDYQRGILKPTEFGRAFGRVVISAAPRALPAGKSAEPANDDDASP